MHLLAAQPGSVDDGAGAVDLGQSPGDIVFITAADTEISAVAHARRTVNGENKNLPSLRIANQMHLNHNMTAGSYGLARIVSLAFKEWQGAIFANVAHYAIRETALQTFKHMHRLSLRFHLQRQTGGRSRAIERGTRGIEFVLRMALFNIVPTMIEIVLVGGLLWAMLNGWFPPATMGTIAAYVVWTVVLTNCRTRYRPAMNESDSRSHTKTLDRLVNY